MEKVKVTKEVANAIEEAKYHFNLEAFTKFINSTDGYNSPHSKILRNEFLPEDRDVLLQAIFYGYEAEPKFKLNDWVVDEKLDKVGQISKLLSETRFTVTWEHGSQCDYGQGTTYLRHATENEITKGKRNRWWGKHNREVYQFKKGDLTYIPYIHNLTAGFYEVDVAANGFEWIKNESEGSFILDDIDCSKIKVVCFVENRMDADTNE